MTADPKAVPDARIVPALHYREAAELAYYGAKILHPRTILPLLSAQIPLRIRNTFFPDQAGTLIGPEVGAGAFPVKALSAIKKQALVSIEGNGMMGVPGIAGKTFATLAQAGISVSMISQASSEASICFVVPQEQAQRAQEALHEAFALEFHMKLLDRVRIRENAAIIAVVGLGMSGTPGIAAQCFRSLGERRVNIVAIAQGSSELNISIAVDEVDVEKGLQALHRAFRLEKFRVVESGAGGKTHFFIHGFGQIGRALADQFQGQANYLREKLRLEIVCAGAADSATGLFSAKGLSEKVLREAVAAKNNKQNLAGFPESGASSDEARKLFLSHGFQRGVLVDCTARDGAEHISAALQAGFHVVLANKKPLCVKSSDFHKLFELARSKQLQIRYEATVGAGLPILDTIQKLKDVGDQILSIAGCLSGTLGYLMTELEKGTAFSAAVTSAFHLGYTEPDPRDDLSGIDVARKALILARTLGFEAELSGIAVEALFPEQFADLPIDKFLTQLLTLDKQWQDRIVACRSKGQVLRYAARIEDGAIKVGIIEVDKNAPLGNLRGTDNQVMIRTKRYSQNPLIVSGPGAGAAVTAAGVFNDIIAIAGQEESNR